MRTTQIITIAYQKLRSSRAKTLLLMLPIAFLLASGLMLAAEAANVKAAISQHVIGALQEQSKYITLVQNIQPSRFGNTQPPYNSGDVQKVEAIDGVKVAALAQQVPISTLTTTDLITQHTVTINSVTALDSTLAKQYADHSMEYDGKGAIPIVLSANQLQEMTEDWGGKTDIDVNMSPPSSGGPANVDLNSSGGPIGTRALAYDRQELIGKEFTVSVGAMPAQQDYEVQPGESFGQLTYHKYTEDEMSRKESAREQALSPYWNYAALSQPKTYTFKLVGIIDSQSSQTAYIPPAAAQKIMQDNIQKQLSSRTGEPVPGDKLAHTFTGLTFDGTILAPNVAASGVSTFGGSGAASYAVPGLVVRTDNTGLVSGIVDDSTVYEKAIPTATSIFLSLNDVYHRPAVVAALNKAGYAYQDTGKLDGLINLKQRLASAVTVFMALFGIVVVISLIVAFTRFVSESRREIGIFRALGATKRDVGRLFVWQGALVGAGSYIAGLSGGILATFGLAPAMTSWFNNVVRNSVDAQSVARALVSSDSFTALDVRSIVIFSILLWSAIIITASIVSVQAARVSPAEAVKSE